jgi:uncharacterized protein (TIGR03437 family)
MKVRHYLICLAMCSVGAWAQQYTISTVAGNHTQGYMGDGSAATSAEIYSPGQIAIDSSGDIYFADTGNHRIRKISGGTISTVAGNGTAGYSGDTKAATSAELRGPTGVALDSSGNLYIADSGNHVVREVSGGNISTIAGVNSNGAGYTGDGGTAVTALLSDPVALAIDSSGDVFIADAGNNVIRKIVKSTGFIYTVIGGASTPLFQLNHPDGLAIDSTGRLFVADTGDRRIIKFENGVLFVVAGNGSLGDTGDGGPALDAGMGDPMGIAVDSTFTLYIADTIDSRVRKISPDGIITTIAGDGIATYFGDGGLATNAALAFPRAVAVDSSGNVYVSDSDNNVIRLLKPGSPSISANGVVNGASFKSPVSPGALASVFGTNFTSQNVGASGLPLQTTLSGVTVTVNGKAAPVLYVTSNQVNFQVPWETALGTANVTVMVDGRTSNSVSVPVVIAAPELFVSGGQAIVQNAGGSLNSPSNPAKVGSTVTAYSTGSGPVSPAVADGAAAPQSPPAMVTDSVSATIGTDTAHVSFAGLAPGFVGLLQLNIEIPSGLATGSYPLTVTIAGEASNSAKINVTQ